MQGDVVDSTPGNSVDYSRRLYPLIARISSQKEGICDIDETNEEQH